MKYEDIPKEIQKYFPPLDLKRITFKVNEFEELMLKDMAQFDDDMRTKLNRNVTSYVFKEIDTKIETKQNVTINIKGRTRSGKSLIGLKIEFYKIKKINEVNKKNALETEKLTGKKIEVPPKIFDTEKIVCGNQKEYRQKLAEAEFSDTFLVDENAFNNVGTGIMSEMGQLKNLQNIVAKMNPHTTYITPKVFLDTGADIGLAYYGRNGEHWVSRFLVYYIQNGVPTLLGYAIFNVGELFQDCGCFVYKFTGGCTNPKRLTEEQIPKEVIKHSPAIPKDYKQEELADYTKQCPFYNICQSQLCKYEHKKDKWIDKEMKGGMDDRLRERMQIAIKIAQEIGSINDDGVSLKYDASGKDDLILEIKMLAPEFSSAQLTGTEIQEIFTMLRGMTNKKKFERYCKQIELDVEEEWNKIPQN